MDSTHVRVARILFIRSTTALLLFVLSFLQFTISHALSTTYGVSRFAGSPGTTGSTDGTGTGALFRGPAGLSIFPNGTIIVADTSNHIIRLVTPAGVVTTIAGLAQTTGSADGSGTTARFYEPWDVAALHNGMAVVADYQNHAIQLISDIGVVSTLAGLKGSPGVLDGTGTSARFFRPTGIAAASDALFYVATTTTTPFGPSPPLELLRR
jgi:hypothetical protein